MDIFFKSRVECHFLNGALSPPVSVPRIHPASMNPTNIVAFRVDYQYGVYIILSIDVNNYYNVSEGGPGGIYLGPPSWLTQCDIYYSGSLQYKITDLSGIVFASYTSYPFNDPGNLTSDSGIAFWTSDGNISANFYNLMSIASLSYLDIYVTNVSFLYACFKEGSMILTDQGYQRIEQLKKGDRIQTLKHGFVPIDMIGRREIFHPANETRLIDQLYRCSPSVYPELMDDLILTGAHSILVDNYKNAEESQRAIDVNKGLYVTDGKARLPAAADERAVVYEIAGTYMIYHLALEHDDYYMNYGIYANGLLVETSSKRYMKELSHMTLLE